MTSLPHQCPECHIGGALTLHLGLTTRPMGSHSLAGMQTKFSARETAEMRCSACGAAQVGRLDDVQVDEQGTIIAGYFVEDPS